MNKRRWTPAELNAMDRDTFTRVVGPVFEHSPWIAEAAWNSRPFDRIDALHAALSNIVAQSGQAKQLALIQAHPDLVTSMSKLLVHSPTPPSPPSEGGEGRGEEANFKKSPLPNPLPVRQGEGEAAGGFALTPASAHEQAHAGLDRLDTSEIEAFQKYNQQYRDRFGFPFIICARLNKKESILAAFPLRLMNDRETEIQTALGEIARIARLRLEDLVQL